MLKHDLRLPPNADIMGEMDRYDAIVRPPSTGKQTPVT